MKLLAIVAVAVFGACSDGDDRLSISAYLDEVAARPSVVTGDECTIPLPSDTKGIEWALVVDFTSSPPTAASGTSTTIGSTWNHDTQDGPNGMTYHGQPIYDPREFKGNFENSHSVNPSLDAMSDTRADFIECE